MANIPACKALATGVALAVVLAGSGVTAEPAPVKATFIDGTYATAEGCKKLDAIAKGGPKNVGTVPETLTAGGFESWEGGCTFTSIKETAKGKAWTAKMACAEEAEEDTETDTFEIMADGRIKVINEGKTTMYERCKTKEAN